MTTRPDVVLLTSLANSMWMSVSLRPQSNPLREVMHMPSALKLSSSKKLVYAKNAMDPFQKAKKTMQRIVTTGDWRPASELLRNLLQREELRLFSKSPSPFVQLEEIFDEVAKLTVFVASLHPPTLSSEKLADNIYFYDIAEGLMAMYTFGEFDIRYMPIARQRGAADLERVKKLLEEVGIIKDNVLTGLGQMAAKSLLYYATRRGLYVESIYLSALIAHTLFAEMRNFGGSGRAALMEAVARHKRLTDAVRDWLRMSPKLYHRDLPLFYEWEDTIKDFAIIYAEKEEDFRFSV